MGGRKGGKRRKGRKVKPSPSSSSSSSAPQESSETASLPFNLYMRANGYFLYEVSGEDHGEIVPEEGDLESDGTIIGLYFDWCKLYGIEYTSDELASRFPNFKRNAFRIFKYNQENPTRKRCMFFGCDEDEP